MRSQLAVYAIAVGATIFASGVAVGQRTGSSKFAKYLRPSVRTEIDVMTLEANVDLIRARLPMDDGMSAVPYIQFSPKENQLQASLVVFPEFERLPLEKVRQRIALMSVVTYEQLKAGGLFPDLSEDDFVLKVIRPTAEPSRRLFAECKHGNVLFH